MPDEEFNFDEFDLNFQETEEVQEEAQETPAETEETAEDSKENLDNNDENPEESGKEKEQEEQEQQEEEEQPEEGGEESSNPDDTAEEIVGDVTYKPYAQALFDVNGWEWDDELMEADSLESFNSLIKNIIDVNLQQQKENDKPFATDSLERVNELVKKGADPKEAFSSVYDVLDYDKVDLKNTSTQEKLAKEYFQKTTRFSEARIEKEIEKAKDLDELEELAEEGLEALKELKVGADKDLEKQLEKQAEQEELNRIKALEDTTALIHKADTIAGYKMDKKLATAFSEYVSKEDDKTGKTAYQTFIEKTPDWQIQAAMLAFKKADKSKVDKMDETAATRILREKVLGAKGKAKSSSSTKKPTRVVPSGENPAAKDKVDFSDFVLK